MHLYKTDFNGNPNIGLLGYCTDKYCLVGRDMPDDLVETLHKVLNVPVHQISICGTNLFGAFLTGNSSCLLVPEIAFPQELEELEKLKIPFKVIETELTALGNNVLCNDTGALVNPDFTDVQREAIQEALGVPVKVGTIAGLNIVGSLAVINDYACLLHRDAAENEMEVIATLLNTECEPGTVNMGSPYVRSGLLVNNHGFIVGAQSGGPEIQHIDEVLGFLERETE